MRRRHSPSFGRHRDGAVLRRVAVTVVAAALVVAAEVAATVSATAAHRANAHHIRSVQARVTPTPYGGEPHLSLDSHIPSGPRIAAVTFVRDYALWRSDRLATIPATDATLRVIRLLERERTSAGVATDVAMRSVRIASAEGQRYVVTSAVGNFRIATRRSRWLVVSLPGT